MEIKPMIALTLSVVAVILLILTFFFPWYNVQGSMESAYQYEEEYYQEYDYKSEMNYDGYFDRSVTETKYTSFGTTERDKIEEDHEKDLKITSVFSNTRIFVIIAIIFIAIGSVFIYLVTMGKLDHKIAVIILAIGFAFALIAPVYMMTSFPSAIEDDGQPPAGAFYGDTMDKMTQSFFGSDIENVEGMKMETTWGGSTSWFIAIIATVITAGSMVIVYLYVPEEEPEVAKEHIEDYEELVEEQEPIPMDEEDERMIVN